MGLLRICALPTAEVLDDQEELLHQAAGSMSLAACCGDDKKADFVDGKKLFHALPPFLDELAAPASKGVLTLWAKIVKGALKDIKAGRAIDPRRLQSVIRLLDLLSECRELEVLSPKYEQMAVHEAGLKEEYLMQVRGVWGCLHGYSGSWPPGCVVYPHDYLAHVLKKPSGRATIERAASSCLCLAAALRCCSPACNRLWRPCAPPLCGTCCVICTTPQSCPRAWGGL